MSEQRPNHLGPEAVAGWIPTPAEQTDPSTAPEPIETGDAPELEWPEYPDAESCPARWGHASLRGGAQISHITIHRMAGSYEGTCSWFQDPNNPYFTSAHYSIALDGRVVQHVWEHLAAHHVGVHNGYTLGIEHEDQSSHPQEPPPGWVTDELLNTSAKLVAYLCQKYGIPLDWQHIMGHYEFSGQTHTDPKPHWPWDEYMGLVNQYAGMPTEERSN